MTPDLLRRTEDGVELPFLVWPLEAGARAVSTAVLGGGIGERSWVVNAQVPAGYDRLDPDEHLRSLARLAGLCGWGAGVGLLTAADVDAWVSRVDGGVRADVTAGVRVPTWAAAPPQAGDPELDRADRLLTPPARRPGTINVVAFVPVALGDGAMVNAVATATEAKTQALLELGVPGTGTATDAVCIVCAPGTGAGRRDGHGPDDRDDHDDRDGTGVVEPFGGPRSTWGARLARAVHASVLAGVRDSLDRMGLDGDAGGGTR